MANVVPHYIEPQGGSYAPREWTAGALSRTSMRISSYLDMSFAQRIPRLTAKVLDNTPDLAPKLIRRFVGSFSSSNMDSTSTLMRELNTSRVLQKLIIRVASLHRYN